MFLGPGSIGIPRSTPRIPSVGVRGSMPVAPGSGLILAEDFVTRRLCGAGDGYLYQPYLGEDGGGQTASLDTGSLKVNVPAANGCYMEFRPYAPQYPFPQGYAQYLNKSGTWTNMVNRLIFLVKTDITVARRSDGGSMLQLGTYTKAHNDSDASRQGDHYYHLYDPNFYAGKWMKIIVTNLPQHQVGGDATYNWPNNPSNTPNTQAEIDWTTANAPDNPRLHYIGVDYMDGLTRWYFDTQDGPHDGNPVGAFASSNFWFDDILFKAVTGEPDDEISSMTALYTGTKYEVTWAGMKNVNKTYEIRYKTTSMKISGFTSGTDGGTVTNPGSAYTGCIWTSPTTSELSTGVYFAVRVQGQTAFSEIFIPNGMSPGNHGE